MLHLEGSHTGSGLRFAVVVAKFNDFVTERLQAGALDALASAGVSSDDISVIKVPGAFEIPFAARQAAEQGRVAAVVCLGCLIKGATPHFEYIASAASHGIADAAASTGVPMTFGVLTTSSVEEALERAGAGPSNKGWEAAMAAVEMATLGRKMKHDEAGDPVSDDPSGRAIRSDAVKPSGAGTPAVKPSGAGVPTVKPSGAGAPAIKPSGAGAPAIKPSGAGAPAIKR